MKVLGIDYGEKRIGLALSDETRTFGSPLSILSQGQFWETIPKIVVDNQVKHIALGLPLNMSGEKTAKTYEVEKFALKLEALLGLPIEFIDERLTSVMASRVAGKAEHIDDLAAQIILQIFLDKKTKNVRI